MAWNMITAPVGTYSNASSSNGGGYDDATYVGSFAQLHDGNGGPVDSALSATVENNGSGILRITSAGSFSNTQEGHLVFVDFAATYADDWYAVAAVDGSGNYIDISESHTGDTTADVLVGGFFSGPSDADDNGLIGGGEFIKIITATYTLSANWTTTAGSVGLLVTYKTVDSSGNDVFPPRASQGALLTKTNMTTIDCSSSYYILPNDYQVFSGLHFTSSYNNTLFAGSFDACVVQNCVFENTLTNGNLVKLVAAFNQTAIYNCDFITPSTNTAQNIIAMASGCSMDSCVVKSSSASATLIDTSSLYNKLVNNIFVGSGKGGTRGIALYLYGNVITPVTHNTFYGLDEAIYVDTYLTSAPLQSNSNLVVDCTTFVYNNVAVDVKLQSDYNCLVNVTNDYTGNTNSFVGLYGVNDISSAQTSAQTFTDASSGDYTLLESSDAVGADAFANDCGALQYAATGGGGGMLINGGLLV